MSAHQTAAAWQRFAEGIAACGQEFIAAHTDLSPEDIVDGYRHLAHLVRDSLTWYMEADPDFPRFIHLNDTAEIADNRFAAIRPDASYLVTGRTDTLFDINISLHAGFNFMGQRQVWGDLGLPDLQVAPDGSIEILLTPEPSPEGWTGNWLAIDPAARFVQLREFYYDWASHRPGSWEIVRLGSEGMAPPRQSPDEAGAALDQALAWVRGYLATHQDMIERRYPQQRNHMTQPVGAAGGNRNLRYGFMRFAFQPDEAVVVSFAGLNADSWTIQWLTDPWYENPDLANRETSLMGHHAEVGPEGAVDIVLAASDPGVPNWLDTAGYARGVAVLRWFRAENDPPVTSRVVPLASLAGTGQGDRSASQRRRRSHFAKRNR